MIGSLALAWLGSMQGGWRTEKVEQYGIEFPCPRDYDTVPVQPTEKWIVLQYAEELPEKSDDRKRYRPEFRIVWIDRLPTAPAATNPTTDAPTPEAPAAGGAEDGGVPPDSPAPIDGIERYVERQMPGWKLSNPRTGRTRAGRTAREFELAYTPVKQKGWSGGARDTAKLVGWVCAWEAPECVVALVGLCDGSDAKDVELQRDIWRNSAEKMEFFEPESKDVQKILRLYEDDDLVGEDHRIQVRRTLPRGWEAEDTPNYIVIYDVADQPLIRIIKRELEAVREAYLEIFPPDRPIEAVSTVRVCKDRDEYLQYGGMEGSGGYWNPVAKELVFYDYENVRGKAGTGKSNSRIVLYHEAFHQYIHHSTGELAPHSWFDEGNGDYFSGAVIDGTKITKIDVNPWRIDLIQTVIRAGKHISWPEIIRYEKERYYAPDIRSICYAQGWSMVYFLRESKQVKKRTEWARILPTYFTALKQAFAKELAVLEAAGRAADPASRAAVGKTARETAVTAAFEGVDMTEIEAEWVKFTLGLEARR